MAGDGTPEADVEILARAAADEIRFDTQPQVRVTFPGTGRRDSRQVTRRQNIDTPVQPGKSYRNVFVATRISSRLLDADRLGSASVGRDAPAGDTSSRCGSGAGGPRGPE